MKGPPILDRLDKVRRVGSGWRAICPVHDDHNPSLGIDVQGDTVLIFCQTCGADGKAVCAALGIDPAEHLFLGTPKSNGRLGLEVARYGYTDAGGNRLYDSVRYSPKAFRLFQPGGSSGGIQGIERVLYRLPEVVRAVAAGETVYVVEGEKDADRLTELGLVATTNPMGAGKWSKVDSSPLTGASVVIIPDNDQPGRSHAEHVRADLVAKGATVRVANLPDLLPGGDVSDWLKTGRTLEDLQKAIEDAPEQEPWDTQDLVNAMAGNYAPPPRGVLYREDGEGLLYTGQVHAVVAEPEAGKTLLAYVALKNAGERPVVLVDFEMGPIQAAERLKLLGVYEIPPTWTYVWGRPVTDVVASVPSGAFVVVDATDGAFTQLDLDPDRTKDASQFKASVVDALKAKECTVMLLDHASTSRQERKRGAMGNTKKLGNVDVSLYIKAENPGSPHHVGRYQIYVDKDRSAQLRGISNRKGAEDHLATMQTETSDGILLVGFLAPQSFRPTYLMERVSRWLEEQDAAQSKNAIETNVEGKASAVRKALDLLVEEGYVARSGGEKRGTATFHRSLRAYREADDMRHLTPRPRPADEPSVLTSANDTDEDHLNLVPYEGGDEVRGVSPLPRRDEVETRGDEVSRQDWLSPPAEVGWRGVVEHVERTPDLLTFKVRGRAEAALPAQAIDGPAFGVGDTVRIVPSGPSKFSAEIVQRTIPM